MQHPGSRLAAVPIATVALLFALAPAGCDSSPPPAAPDVQASHGHAPSLHRGRLAPGVARDIARLRERTARFHRFDVAAEAGWSMPIPDCFTDPQRGAMGFHYGNPALIDGTVNVVEPELLLYEPQKNGRLRFVAVEYIVPFTAWTGAEPPRLFGQSFHRNEAFGLWVLHVWHMRENPAGIFADWNPKVSCQYAP